MAIVLCKECGKEMSDTAKICPNCGYDYTAKAKAKKKKIDSWIKLLFFLALAFFVYKCSTFGEQEKREKAELVAKIKDEHCRIDWSKLNQDQKTKILNEFIDNEFELSRALEPSSLKSVGYDAKTLLNSAVKYPNTIKIEGENPGLSIYFSKSDAQIKNIDKGIIEYSKSFTTENKLGMEVKSAFWFKIKYNAECKTYSVVDFKVE